MLNGFLKVHITGLVLLLGLLQGCVSRPPATGEGAPMPPESVLTEKKGKPTQVKISYGNRSSKMSMVLDIDNNDVFIQMNGRPASMAEKKYPWLEGKGEENKPSSNAQLPENKAAPKLNPEDEGSEDGWGDVMDIPRKSDLNREGLERVLAEIRRAQEWFYQKKYPEALDMTKLSIQKQETAEAYALMGSILFMMGDKQGARESWIQSLRLNPDMPSVSAMLERLKNDNE